MLSSRYLSESWDTAGELAFSRVWFFTLMFIGGSGGEGSVKKSHVSEQGSRNTALVIHEPGFACTQQGVFTSSGFKVLGKNKEPQKIYSIKGERYCSSPRPSFSVATTTQAEPDHH